MGVQVVGKAGAAVNKLRESLGVNIDFEELAAEVESKQAKNRVARSKVTIKGRKENVEEAKKRILSQEGKLVSSPSFLLLNSWRM
jgi:predicted PilT family ATPase